MADGRKRVETRSWPQRSLQRGDLFAIHASKGWTIADRHCAEAFGYDPDTLPRGEIVALVFFKGCWPTELFFDDPRFTQEEESYGDYSAGRFGWVCDLWKKLDSPIPCKGALSLWFVPYEISEQLAVALR